MDIDVAITPILFRLWAMRLSAYRPCSCQFGAEHAVPCEYVPEYTNEFWSPVSNLFVEAEMNYGTRDLTICCYANLHLVSASASCAA